MKKILVLCPNVWDKEALLKPAVGGGHELVFAGEELLETPPLLKALRFDVFRYMRAIVDQHRGSGLSGVIGTGDYPGAMMAAFVGRELGLTVPDPRAITILSHKYYSREIQKKATPTWTPDYFSIDPFAPFRMTNGDRRLEYPFFVKPVKGTMSIRAQMVKSDGDLSAAVKTTLKERLMLTMLLRPFQQLLDAYSDRRVPAHHFIGEAPLRGAQVTVDGFVQNKKAQAMGIVDSIMYPGTTSFKRFETPSSLPRKVQEEMERVTCELIESTGFDHACFNVELFYDEDRAQIHIIEINPRMSYQFADLYERIDGLNTYQIQIELALGRPITWTKGHGRDSAAASFVMRRFQDGRTVRVPSREEIARVEAEFPGTTVKVLAKLGERLSDQDQDVGSYRYAIVNMGAKTAAELHENYRAVEEQLTFEFT